MPPVESDKLSELGRKKNLDKVFMTKDEKSAEIYAKKAIKQFGGKPIVYLVEPVGELSILQSSPGTTVYMADSANVISGRTVESLVRKVY